MSEAKAPTSVSVKVFYPAHAATARGSAGAHGNGDIRRFPLSLSSTHRPEGVRIGGHEGTTPRSPSSGPSTTVFNNLARRVAELAVPPLSTPFSLTWKGMSCMRSIGEKQRVVVSGTCVMNVVFCACLVHMFCDVSDIYAACMHRWLHAIA